MKANGAPSPSATSAAAVPPAPNLADTALAPDTSTARPSGGGTKAWIGRSLGKYQITNVLGQGAMGVVLKAHDLTIERDVAIKVLADHLATDATALARFLAEARAAGKINHPNVMGIYEICQDGPTHYLVLEFVTGGSLEERMIGARALPVIDATRAMIDACKGVGAAHAAGLIHRDIKPANFMCAADGSIKVADFGLAKATADSSRNLTQTGSVLGTPYFMSPEQCEAKPLDHRSDIYSLGATYYCLLTGENPYQDSESVPQLMYAHCHKPVPNPGARTWGLPEACTRIVARAMAKAPADRYQSAAEMLRDLEMVGATLTGQARIALPSESQMAFAVRKRGLSGRRLYSTIGAVALCALLGVTLAFWRPWQQPKGGANIVPIGEPVKIGVLHSLSGTMATSEAPVVDAVLFAIDEVNQAGGVLGRPVKAVLADGRSDDSTFAHEAARLITKENVSSVIGCWTSSSRKTVKPIFDEHQHLLLYPVQFEGLESSPSIIYLGASPNQQILPAVQWAVNTLHKKRFFLVGSDYVYPRAANAIINDHLKKADIQVVSEMYIPLGSQKVEAVIDAILRAKPDFILNTINGDTNVAFFRALRAAAVTPANTPTMSFSVGEQALRSLNPADLVGDYAATMYFESVETPENEVFVRRFHEKYPHGSVTDPMETAYVGVKLWAAAVNEAQSLDPKKIRRALIVQRLNGPGGEIQIDSDTQYCFRTPRIGQIQPDGHFKVVWTAAEPVRPEPYPSSRSAEAWRAMLHDLYVGWGSRWSAP